MDTDKDHLGGNGSIKFTTKEMLMEIRLDLKAIHTLLASKADRQVTEALSHRLDKIGDRVLIIENSRAAEVERREELIGRFYKVESIVSELDKALATIRSLDRYKKAFLLGFIPIALNTLDTLRNWGQSINP